MRTLATSIARICLLLHYMASGLSAAGRLRKLLASEKLEVMPCCYDGLTARLVEKSGFEVTFMSGYSVSASRGYPDVQLVSLGEMLDSGRTIVSSLRRGIPCIADGDTGHGNAMNVKRTVHSFAQIGMAGVMIEDQVAPKRCGHTKGKAVVDRSEAISRVKAACDARDEIRESGLYGDNDVIILARTDANAVFSFDEAVTRCQLFRDAGADMTFLEAPTSIEEMELYCKHVDGPKLANMLEGGATPILSADQLQDIGYSLAAYPLTLLSSATKAMTHSLQRLKETGGGPLPADDDTLLTFSDLCSTVGFNDYYEEEERYRLP